MKLMQFQIDDIIKTALNEDINYIDVTTDYLIDDKSISTARYFSKDEGVLCGIDVALRVFELLDENVKTEILIHDGEKVKKGDIIARITGSTKALLKGERTRRYEKNSSRTQSAAKICSHRRRRKEPQI